MPTKHNARREKEPVIRQLTAFDWICARQFWGENGTFLRYPRPFGRQLREKSVRCDGPSTNTRVSRRIQDYEQHC